MKRMITCFLLVYSSLLVSCGVGKKIPDQKMDAQFKPALPETSETHVKIVKHSLEFLGTKYHYGGTNHQGIDCSGLVYTAFSKEGIAIPRSSWKMALAGKSVDPELVEKGDLLFFQTDKKKSRINHVGLVVGTGEQDIQFIHSTTSRGVIISSLSETYWKNHFVEARRLNVR